MALTLLADKHPPRGAGVKGFPLLLLNMPGAAASTSAFVVLDTPALMSSGDKGIDQRWYVTNRLQRPLDYGIDITRFAFLRGRDISDSIRYHLGLAARLRELGLPGWLLHSDLTKPYVGAGSPGA